MDEKHLEYASALTDSIVDAGIASARSRLPKPDNFEGFCTCGAEIPTKRIADQRWNCVDCQSALERRSKFYSTGG